jgi:hypothetical protein
MMTQRIASESRWGATVRAAGLLVTLGLAGGPAWAGPVTYTARFPLEACAFDDGGRNLHFSLQRGDWWWFEGDEKGELVQLEIVVLNQTLDVVVLAANGAPRTIRTRVVREQEWVDGQLVEVSWNYFARCQETNDIYYFGEDVDIYEGGQVVSHDGAWLAGVDGAMPGIIMPGTFLLGSRYYQELAPGVAEDRGEHVQMELALTVPAGAFTGCVEVKETSPLEPGKTSVKRYCPGIGLVADNGVLLVDYEVDAH